MTDNGITGIMYSVIGSLLAVLVIGFFRPQTRRKLILAAVGVIAGRTFAAVVFGW